MLTVRLPSRGEDRLPNAASKFCVHLVCAIYRVQYLMLLSVERQYITSVERLVSRDDFCLSSGWLCRCCQLLLLSSAGRMRYVFTSSLRVPNHKAIRNAHVQHVNLAYLTSTW